MRQPFPKIVYSPPPAGEEMTCRYGTQAVRRLMDVVEYGFDEQQSWAENDGALVVPTREE